MKQDNAHIYPPDEWNIIETTHVPERIPRNETIFALANGYLGVRGTFEEKQEIYRSGTYVNGFFDSRTIQYEEWAYGFAEHGQRMLTVPDGTVITLLVNDENFDLSAGTVRSYTRNLDMKHGLLSREVVWESPGGTVVSVKSRRLVSFVRKHLLAVEWSCTPLNREADITITSGIDGTEQPQTSEKDPRVGAAHTGQALQRSTAQSDTDLGFLEYRTAKSRLGLCCAMTHTVTASSGKIITTDSESDRIWWRLRVKAGVGEQISLEKYVAYVTSHDVCRPASVEQPDAPQLQEEGPEHRHPSSSPAQRHQVSSPRRQSSESTSFTEKAVQEVQFAKTAGFERIRTEQQEYLEAFWKRSDIHIEGDPVSQQSSRFCIFHLLQASGTGEGCGIPAKGLTGEGYEGHYFWDTEIFVLPFFIYTNPDIARDLLTFRYATLPQAKARANELSFRGALYPWRTITGEEASSFFPAGTAQFHIDADIAYTVKKYVQVTGDTDFLYRYGAEILIETARFWFDLGDYIEGKGFCLNTVTGPDEYTALVNNNVYTNIMAKDNLEYAAETVRALMQENPSAYTMIASKTGCTSEEIEQWERAATRMYIPYDRNRGLYPQDDSFFDKAVWDFENTPQDRYPLLLHYHPLVIYRYQVLKQPDLVLAMFLQSSRFSAADKRRNFRYYETLTTGDSSLSPSTQSIIACEIGAKKRGYSYFLKSSRMDIDNINKNVKDGVHIAAMGGAWLSLIYGFIGLRDDDGQIRFSPSLPPGWKSLTVSLQIRENVLSITVRPEAVTYALEKGDELTMFHQYQAVILGREREKTIPLTPRLQAVIFDLDGVITDTAEYHYQAWKKLADSLDIPFDRTFNEQLKGIGREESLRLILSRSSADYSDEQIHELADMKNRYYQELLDNITPDDLLPGMQDLLHQLKQRGINIALASASRNAVIVMKHLQIEDIFDAVIDGYAFVKGKPDPEVFLNAAEALAVPPKHCIGIEDAQAGIEAINDAGMYSVGIGDRLSGARLRVSSTEELTSDFLIERFQTEWNP